MEMTSTSDFTIEFWFNSESIHQGSLVSLIKAEPNQTLADWKTIKANHLIYIELSYEQKQLYTSEVFKTTKILVEDSLLNPDMEFNVIDITL